MFILPSYSTLLAFIYTMSNKEKLMGDMRTIAVGSKNPVKVNAVSRGFERVASFFPSELLTSTDTPESTCTRIEGIDVPSGVSDQPMGDSETKTGALNRAKAAYAEYEKLFGSPPTLSVGLEGGVSVDSVTNIMECFAWILVFDGEKSGAARTASFPLPPVMRDMVMIEGMELGDADDKVFSTINSKQNKGTIGKLTHGVIDRTAYYETAVVLAMIPFLWPDLYREQQLEIMPPQPPVLNIPPFDA